MKRIAVISAVLALAFHAAPAGAQELGLEIGSTAPPALVKTLDGKPVDLGSFVGKVPVFMEFWAFWCPNCKKLEPQITALQKKYGKRMKFLGVAVSVNQTAERVKAYAARHGFVHETLFDADGNATDAYDVPATSYVVIVDARGRVVYTGLGGDQKLEKGVLEALR
jgi:thiol-disulfide isomerase/thioredoxin